MQRKYKVKVRHDKSDHDGYCSDDECALDTFEKEYDISLEPHENEQKEKYIGKVGESYILNVYQGWPSKIPITVGCGGSGECSLSSECKELGLTCHDEKVTILKITPK
jgi:hypothetical protein